MVTMKTKNPSPTVLVKEIPGAPTLELEWHRASPF